MSEAMCMSCGRRPATGHTVGANGQKIRKCALCLSRRNGMDYKGREQRTKEMLLRRFVLGGHIEPADIRTLRAAGLIAPAGNGFDVTPAGREAMAR